MKLGKGWILLTIRQFLKFGMVGFLNTGISISTIFILMKLFGVSYVVSNVVGYGLAVINSFIWNKLWTFKGKGNLFGEIARFFGIFLICYFLQLGLLVLLKEHIHISADLSQLIAMAFYIVLNFIGHKLFTFRDAKYASN